MYIYSTLPLCNAHVAQPLGPTMYIEYAAVYSVKYWTQPLGPTMCILHTAQ